MKKTQNYTSYATITLFIGWGLLALLILLLIPLSYGVVLPAAYWVNQSAFFLSLIGLSVFNSKFLAPAFLFKRKIVQYYLYLLVSCILVIILLASLASTLNLGELIHNALRPGQTYKPRGTGHYMYFYIFFLQVSVLGISITVLLLKKWLQEEKLRLETEEKNANMELAYLKAQINPHFFFNSLNTIHALTYKDVDNSRQALNKLSHIMRYVLYDTQHKRVPLNKEIEFIKMYIDLSRLRISKAVEFSVQIDVPENNLAIAPMLLLPFIENCFKHGISSQQESKIWIQLKLEEKTLHLIAKNKIIKRNPLPETAESSGIGLKNTMRRLNLLYPQTHQIVINPNNPQQEYWVDFKLELI